MSLIRPLMLAAAMLAAPVAFAHANGTPDVKACKAMTETLAPKQADIAEMTATRDTAAAKVEAAGDAWEDAETHRLVSSSHAVTADQAKASYDEARQTLARQEMALQASVRQYNDDVAAFNSRCARK